MSKGGGTQTVTQNIDPQTRAYVDQIRQRALGVAGTPNTGAQQALGGFQQFANLGLSGANALAGDPSAVAQFMNPYQATLDPYWNQIRQQTLGTVNDAATQASAFGGSRHGVAAGQALADVGNAQAQQRYGEFSNAMNRAGGLANLGFGAQQALFGGANQLREQDIDLLMRAVGPYGTSQSQQTQGGGLLGGLGGVLSLASLIPGPWQIPAMAAGGAKNLLGMPK